MGRGEGLGWAGELWPEGSHQIGHTSGWASGQVAAQRCPASLDSIGSSKGPRGSASLQLEPGGGSLGPRRDTGAQEGLVHLPRAAREQEDQARASPRPPSLLRHLRK